MISPRVSSTRGDLGPETLRRELASFDLPDAGRGIDLWKEAEKRWKSAAPFKDENEKKAG